MLHNLTAKLNYQLPYNNTCYTVLFDGSMCRVESNDQNYFSAKVECLDDNIIHLTINGSFTDKISDEILAIGIEYFFSQRTNLKKVLITYAQLFEESSVFSIFQQEDSNKMIVTRESFYQLPCVWHRNRFYLPSLLPWTNTNGRNHPIRPKHLKGTYYRRYFPAIQKTLAFRMIDILTDLDIFHEWHNQERVSCFWELNRSREELRAYLEKGIQDPHQIPMIFEIDGASAGYFEIYWAAEDRIGAYYDYEPYDRGFHLLIGEKKFLGLPNTTAVFQSVLHFLYLDDVRTRRIVAEPRSDNQKFLKYTKIIPSLNFIKEFDFPHKRAALVMSQREQFFKEAVL